MNSNDSDDDMSLYERLVYCIWSGENKAVMRTLEEMNSCDMTDASGRTLLHMAVDSDNAIVAQYLIDRGCKVDAVDNKGDTPLILACKFDYTDVIKILVDAKASILISNNEGVSAAGIVLGGEDLNIHILNPFMKKIKEECSNDSMRTAKELLKIGCTLTRATRLKDTVITKYMMDNGCNINEQDHPLEGWTPLHQALVFKDHENVKLLIDRGADVNVEDTDGYTPVSRACNVEILQILLNKGARVVDDHGTLIAPDLFSYWGKEVVEMLIERFNLKDFSIKDRRGTTLFSHIVSNETFDPIEILQKHFKYSFDIVNQKDSEGSTVLLMAVRAGNVRTVEFLLKMGAKLDASEDWDNEVYYTVARHSWKQNREDREKIIILLLQYGADIQWTREDNRGNQYFTLNYALKRKHFAMVKIILSRLALIEDLGGEIKDVYRQKIEDNAMCKKYFEFCKRTIEKLKRTVIKRRVTLLDFMTCSEERLINFARSEEFVATVKSMVYHKRNSNLYYNKVLRQRVKKAVEVVDLRKNLSNSVNFLIPELQSNEIVIQKIIEYITYDMLWLMAKHLTFKCIIDNS